MSKIAHLIVKHYKFIIVIFAVLCILSCVAVPFVVKRLNSEVMSYLPDETNTASGLKFLQENFGIKADAMMGVTGASKAEIEKIAYNMEKLYYDKEGKGGFYYASLDSEPTGKKVLTQCLWRDAGFVQIYGSLFGDTEQYQELINIFYDDGGTADNELDDTYVFLLNIDFGSSSDEAFKVVDILKNDLVGDLTGGKATFYASGTTIMAKEIFENTIGEVWAYSAAGLAVVMVVLFLFTKSWIDPIIMLLTLGVSILLNIGSNIIFPTNSIITFASSSLLQMALSMDYAVFLLHAYRTEQKSTLDPKEALEKAIPHTFKSIFASAMTTLGGFVALFFMRFGIGADMGGVLAKGILMSFITVLFLQPAFMLIFKKQMDSWQHKAIEWKFRKPVKTVIKFRSVVVALFLIAIFPVVLYQSNLSLNYFGFVKHEPHEGRIYTMVDNASHQLVIAVPYDINNPDSIDKQYVYLEELRGLKEEYDGNINSVTFVLGLNALIPKDNFNDFMEGPFRDALLEQTKQFVNNGYTLYTVGLTNSDIESENAFKTVENIEKVTRKHFDGEQVYVTGMTQAGRDFAAITPNDFQRVTIASVLLIIFILLITFRSLKHSFILILLIEFGIWLNLSIQKMLGSDINFMSYIIISSIQLGATVDYAILITSKYREFRKRMLPAHAAYQATTSSVMSVLTSATILAGACFCVRIMSSVLIVSEVTTLIARGAILSALLTLFVLPSILAFMDRPNKNKTMTIPPQDKLSKHKFFKKKKQIEIIEMPLPPEQAGVSEQEALPEQAEQYEPTGQSEQLESFENY